MEFDFTKEQVWKGEVKYTLSDFIRDFKNEIKYQFKKTRKNKTMLERIFKTFYLVVFLKADSKTNKEIHKMTKMPLDLIKMIVKSNTENIEMLEGIIMAKYLNNIKKYQFISDGLNSQLVNAWIGHFHQKRKL